MNSPGRITARVALFSLILVAVCFANSLPNDFIGDDQLIVSSNPAIRSISPAQFLLSPFWGEKTVFGIYRPLVVFSFSLEYAMWEVWAPGYRFINLLLHAINGVLVFLLARGILQSMPASWAATAVYVVHPVHTEAVVGVAGRSELLAAMFFFLAWLMFRRGRTGLCAIAFLLSLLSKENAVAFPAVIVLDTWISGGSFKKVLQEWKRLGAVAISLVIYIALRLWVLGAFGMPQSAQYMGGRWTWLERELTSGRSFLKYFELLLAPVNLTGNYDFDSIPIAGPSDWDAWLGLLLVIATILFAFRVSRKWPPVAFGILFFYAAMLPMSNWFVPTGVTVAERYLYVSSLGLALIAGFAWERVRSVRIRTLLAAGVLTASALLCISQTYVWRNNFAFFENMVRVFPNNTAARQGYGIELLKLNRPDEALAQFEEGLRVERTAPLLVGLAGLLIQKENNCNRARPLLDEAINNQGSYYARWTLAECFEREGRMPEAEQTYRQAVHEAPAPDARLLFGWGLSLEQTGRPAEARNVYQRAALLEPDDSAIRERLASLTHKGF